MKVIDMHLHLDEDIKGGTAEAMSFLHKEMKRSNIERGLLLHLNVHRFPSNEVEAELKKYDNIIGFVNINPLEKDSCKQLEDAITRKNFKGLKLHPRLNGYLADNKKAIELFKLAGELGVPTLVDAFPDGNSLMLGDEPIQYGRLALSSPDSPLIVAHFGGHKVIDMMLIAKRIPNIYLNVAYTLLYYRSSSITNDLVYAINSMSGKRIFYGSDYPDRELKKSLDLTLDVLKNNDLSPDYIENIMYHNANDFIKNFIR